MEFFGIDISVSKKTLFLFFVISGILLAVSFISKKVYAGGQWIPCDSSHYCQSYGGYYCYSSGWTTTQLQCDPYLDENTDTCYYNGACDPSTGECGYDSESCPDTKVVGDTCYYNRECIDSGCNYRGEDSPKPPRYYQSGSTCYYHCGVWCTPNQGWIQSGCDQCSLSSYCVDDTRYYDGRCTSSGCVFDSSEDCNSYDGWYNYGDVGPGCTEMNDPTASYRDYSCSSGSCVYSTTQTKDCDSYDGWYGGGDNPGCGDDPSSQQRDYYVTSSGTCAYTTTNCGNVDCDSQDVCSNVCENNKIYSYKDYYVRQNSNVCEYTLGSLVEDCLTKSSEETDSGDDPFNRGTVMDYTGCVNGASSCSYNTYTDSCSGDTLTEYIASGSSYSTKTYDCDSYDGWYSNVYRDYSCSDGACQYNSVCTDNNPPVTTASATASGSPYSFGTWTNKDVTITLSATDDCWVNKTYYCIDTSNTCNPVNEYTSSFVVSCGDGNICTYYVRFYSTDNYGRSESIKSVVVKIDKDDPTISFFYINNDQQYTNSINVQLSFSVNDGSGSGINRCEASNDNITWQAISCSSPVSWTLSNGDGIKTVYFRVYDNAGNLAETSDTIILDTGAPTCSVSSIAESSDYAYVDSLDNSYVYYNSNGTGTFTVNVNANDASGIDKVVFPDTTSVGGTDTSQPYSHTYSFDSTDTYEGNSTIVVYDNAGNSNTCYFFVDRDVIEPMTVVSIYDGNNIYSFNWVNHQLKFDISCSDSESGCKSSYYAIVGLSGSCPTNISAYSQYIGSNTTLDCVSGISGYSVCEEKVCAFSLDNVNNNIDLHDIISVSPVLIDKQLPTGDVEYINEKTGIYNDPIVTSVDQIKFVVHANDYIDQKSGLARVEFYVSGTLANGTILSNALVYVNNTLNGVGSTDVYSSSIGPFRDGQTVTYYARIYDRAGNTFETSHKNFNVIFGVNCGGSTRITALTTWNASSELYSNSGGMCGDPSKVIKQMHHFIEDFMYGRYNPVSLTVYNFTDLIAYAPSEDYCVWVDKYGNYACHPVGETFMLDNNAKVSPRDHVDKRIATCLKGTGVVNDDPVLVSSNEVPEGFVFLPSNEHYFHVMWNVNYSTNPRLVGIKCYFNPHKTDAYGHIYWCTFDEVNNGTCPEYQLCKCSDQWPCYQDTNNQTKGTCTVTEPEYLFNVTGFSSSGWPIIQFVENKIFCKFYDPNFENESYTWYNHNFTPIAFNYEFTIPNNTQIVVGSSANIKLRITNKGVIEDTYNITTSTDSPALTVIPVNHETTSVEANDYVDVYFSLRPNYALSSTPVHATFTICSEKMQDILSRTSSDTRKACKEHVLAFNIKMVTMDDNPFSWLFRKTFKNN